MSSTLIMEYFLVKSASVHSEFKIGQLCMFLGKEQNHIILFFLPYSSNGHAAQTAVVKVGFQGCKAHTGHM